MADCRLLIDYKLFERAIVSSVGVLSRHWDSPVVSTARKWGGSEGFAFYLRCRDPGLNVVIVMSLRS
jgi:hypothetical protein